MAELGFYRLGVAPSEDALRMQRLYRSSEIDDCIMDEFGMSVHNYSTLSLPDLTQRIEEKYTGTSPPVFGILATYDNQDIGIAAWIKKSFRDVDSHQEVEGINISAWLLRRYRARGFGREMGRIITAQAAMQGALSGLPVWTSIKPENHVSRHLSEDMGFVETGIQPDRPERMLYFLKSN